MPSLNLINSEINLINNLNDLVQTQEEVYILKMQRIRDRVLRTRHFVNQLSEIFKQLRLIYLYQRQEHPSKNTLVTEKPKSKVAVLLSGQRLFAGAINQKVFRRFINHIYESHPDIVIVGRIGRQLYRQKKITQVYEYWDLPEDPDQIHNLKEIIDPLLIYQQVDVFYGQFVNLIQQVETQSNITGTAGLENQNIQSLLGEEIPLYIFEPSLEEILEFFERQIFTALFKQTLHESYLAQIGSRINSLEESTQNIEKQLKQLSYHKRHLVKRLRNQKQQQRLVGKSIWSSQL